MGREYDICKGERRVGCDHRGRRPVLRRRFRLRHVRFVIRDWPFVSRARSFTNMLAAADTPEVLLSG